MLGQRASMTETSLDSHSTTRPQIAHHMRLSIRTAVALFLCIAIAGAAFAVMNSHALGWRVRVIGAKLAGELPEIPTRELTRWLAPNSTVWLEPLAEYPNVHAAIVNLVSDAGSIESGSQVYGKFCAHCHGDGGRGRTGTDLIASIGNNSDWTFFATAKFGRVGTGMTPQPVSDLEIWQVHAYLRDRAVRSAENDGKPSSRAKLSVSTESILKAAERPHEWLTYAGNYAGHRRSRLSQISKNNIRDLRIAWIAQLRSASADTSLESSPIVAGGLMFVTESPGGVVAIDGRTGERVWQFRRPVPANLYLCCGAVNRGVAMLGETVFVSTLDAYLVALDAATGRKKWESKVADHRDGYAITGAPLALHDRVLVGIAGSEYGIRGFVAAFSAADGRLLWRFNTVPGPGEPGHETWAGNSWKVGGAAPWTTGAYDEKLGLVYWGVGNPAPLHDGTGRTGDNLFSCSVVALDARDGKLRWHFQFTPHDEHDWDSTQQPVLAEISWKGQPRHALITANRNGFFYAVDRATGEFLFANPFVKQTWAAGLDSKGRPIVRPEAAPSRTGSLVWPSVGGGTNWWPPSYDDGRQLLYVPSVDAAGLYFRDEGVSLERGKPFTGGLAKDAVGQPVTVAIKAIEAETGKIRWESQLAQGHANVRKNVGGVLSTSGGLVFVGYDEEFFALDADNGETLWKVRVGGRINAPPVSYAIDGLSLLPSWPGVLCLRSHCPLPSELSSLCKSTAKSSLRRNYRLRP